MSEEKPPEIDRTIESLMESSSALIGIVNELNDLKSESEKKDARIQELEAKLAEFSNEQSGILEEKERLEKELNSITEQLNKISGMYADLSSKEDEKIDVRELLSIYVVLLEQVFAGQPHARVLGLLHGVPEMNRTDITKASGMQPAVVLRSIFDLANANLVDYDQEKEHVRLVRKLY